MISRWMLFIGLLNSVSTFGVDSGTPLQLSPFPNGLEYKPVPEPSNTGNPLLSNTKHIPKKTPSDKPPIKARGAANNYGSVGVVKGTVGNF